MATYRVRLNDPNSEHFRVVMITAASEEEAIAKCLEREARAVAYQIPEDRLEEILAKPEDERSGAERGALHMHQQAELYEVADVRKRGEIRVEVKAPKGGEG